MIELINNIHHYPVTTYSVDADGQVVARDLYPHKVSTRIVVSFRGGDAERPHRLAAHLNKMNGLGGNPLIA